jgi:Cancer susceptibility candidate 1 N-terminus
MTHVCRTALEHLHAHHKAVQEQHDHRLRAEEDWHWHVSCGQQPRTCTVLPQPFSYSEMTDYISAQAHQTLDSLPAALQLMDDHLAVIANISAFLCKTLSCSGMETRRVDQHQRQLYELIEQHSNAATASFLQHASDFADVEGGIKRELLFHTWRYGCWVNVRLVLPGLLRRAFAVATDAVAFAIPLTILAATEIHVIAGSQEPTAEDRLLFTSLRAARDSEATSSGTYSNQGTDQ